MTFALTGFVLFSVPTARAQSAPDTDATTRAAVDRLFECRNIAEASARLACFDREAAVVFEAQDSGDLLLLDREEAEETERGLFGLNRPKTAIFSDDKDAPNINELTATLKEVRRMSNGRFLFVLEDGARWMQTENVVGRQRYKAGDTIVISRAAFGSFKAKVNNRNAARVRRLK